jgi:multidrug resistance efflux pump
VFVKSTQRLPVKIAVENMNGRLKAGMQAVVWIENDSHNKKTVRTNAPH